MNFDRSRFRIPSLDFLRALGIKTPISRGTAKGGKRSALDVHFLSPILYDLDQPIRSRPRKNFEAGNKSLIGIDCNPPTGRRKSPLERGAELVRRGVL